MSAARLLFGSVVILMLWRVSFAASPQILSLQQVFKSTKQHFPLIKVAEENILLAQGQLLGARGNFDPTLDSKLASTPRGGYENLHQDSQLKLPLIVGGAAVFAGYRSGYGDQPSYYGNLLTNRGGESRFGLRVPILQNFLIDKPRAQLQNAYTNIRLQQHRLQVTLNNTLQAAAFAYYQWLSATQKVSLAKSLLSLALTRQKALTRRFQLGAAPEIEVVENNRFILQRRAALLAVNNELRQTAATLSLYYRDALGRPIVPTLNAAPAKLPEVPNKPIQWSYWQRIKKTVIATNPEIKANMAQQRIARVNLRLARNFLLPQLNLEFMSQREHGGLGDPRLRQRQYRAGFQFNFPLPQRVARGDVQVNRSTLLQVNQRYYFLQQSLGVDFVNALYNVDNDRQQVQLLRKELSLNQRIERAERIRFAQGGSSLFLVNAREQATFASQLQLLDAVIRYYTSVINLRTICAFSNLCRIR